MGQIKWQTDSKVTPYHHLSQAFGEGVKGIKFDIAVIFWAINIMYNCSPFLFFLFFNFLYFACYSICFMSGSCKMPFCFHIYCKLTRKSTASTFLAKTARPKLNKSLNEPAHKILVLIKLATVKAQMSHKSLKFGPYITAIASKP